MRAITWHADTILLIHKIPHQVHFVEHLIFQKPKIHNDFLDQPIK